MASSVLIRKIGKNILIAVVCVCALIGGRKHFCDVHAVHISIDDTYMCLKDLQKHDYESVFQNAFFNRLRLMHRLYGTRFTLYVYEEAPDFALSAMTDRYKAEFMCNADWLRFGYHAPSPDFDSLYVDSVFCQSFNLVNRSIIRFAGEQSLTYCLRLHYFWATSTMLRCMADSGVEVLLGADDERMSYGLDVYENTQLLAHGEWIKKVNETELGVKIIRTNKRLEKLTFSEIFGLACLRDDRLIFFTHEWQLEGAHWLLNAFQWMKFHVCMIMVALNNINFII